MANFDSTPLKIERKKDGSNKNVPSANRIKTIILQS
jgi:hypothetical protein